MCNEDPVIINPKMLKPARGWLLWQPSAGQALWYALIAMIGLLHLNQVSEFLYFQF
jgi:hypothetical protein